MFSRCLSVSRFNRSSVKEETQSPKSMSLKDRARALAVKAKNWVKKSFKVKSSSKYINAIWTDCCCIV